MTSLTINQNLALSTNNNYILLEKIYDESASLTEITALEYMFGLRSESSILFDTSEPDKVFTFSSSDPYLYTTQLIEGVSYSHTYSFASNFVNGSTYAYDGLVGNGYYVTINVTHKKYNIFGGVSSTDTYSYKLFYIESSSIKMVLSNGTILG